MVTCLGLTTSCPTLPAGQLSQHMTDGLLAQRFLQRICHFLQLHSQDWMCDYDAAAQTKSFCKCPIWQKFLEAELHVQQSGTAARLDLNVLFLLSLTWESSFTFPHPPLTDKEPSQSEDKRAAFPSKELYSQRVNRETLHPMKKKAQFI